jgi:DNA-binding NtrC family response regulator
MVRKADQAKTCFFVDDEPKVCQAVAKTLGQIGLKVRCFTRPVDCFEQLRRQPCDVLITDLRMPQMDGIQLLTRVKRIMPSLPVLILTGYGGTAWSWRSATSGKKKKIKACPRRAWF